MTTETENKFTYYVGDLAYVLDNEQWQSVCDTMDTFDEFDPDNEDSIQECEGLLEPELFNWDRPMMQNRTGFLTLPTVMVATRMRTAMCMALTVGQSE